MKVAVVGGTGSFGLALARRLVEAGYDVVIGSRDAERAGAAAAEVRAEGASNADAARAADLVVLATKADATLETAEELRDAIGTTPVLSVAAELTFTPGGVLPTPEATSIAARLQERLDGPVIAGLHSLAARNLGADEAPEEEPPPAPAEAPVSTLVKRAEDRLKVAALGLLKAIDEMTHATREIDDLLAQSALSDAERRRLTDCKREMLLKKKVLQHRFSSF